MYKLKFKPDRVSTVAAGNTFNRAVSTFYPVSRQQFNTFVEPFSKGAPFPRAITFSRLVPGSERAGYEAGMRLLVPDFAIREVISGQLQPSATRDRYLVVEYLEPGEIEGVAALGFDALSEPSLRRALDHSAETGQVWGAALVRYRNTPPLRPRFVLLKPVYRPGAPRAAGPALSKAVIGYTSIGMRTEEMIAGILEASGMLRTPGVNMTVYMGDDDPDRIAYREYADPGTGAGVRWPWSTGTFRRLESQDFHVAGIAWRVDIEGQALGPDVGRQPGSWLVALFGIIISVMATLYIWALGSRNRRVHQLVAERTAALYAANERLNADIAARERVEDVLRRTDQTLKNAQRIAHVGSWEIDLDSGGHHWSDECFRIFGLPASGDGVPSLERLPPATRAMWAAIRERLLHGSVDSEEHRIVRPDGSIRHLMLHAEVAGDAGEGRVAAGSVLDISEFKQVETELRQSRASLRELGGHQERIKENERKRIAREIHDELGGLLTGIKAYVSVAVSRVGDPAAAAPLLAEAMTQ
ncbi:MAG: PAS domain S-box protein, partial [Oxalobacteraceae bacterium]